MGPVVGPASTLPLSRLSIGEIRRHVISEGLVAEMTLYLKARQSDQSETLRHLLTICRGMSKR